jgi:hypothetical protein
LDRLVIRIRDQSSGIPSKGLPQERANWLYLLIIGAWLRIQIEGDIAGYTDSRRRDCHFGQEVREHVTLQVCGRTDRAPAAGLPLDTMLGSLNLRSIA